MKREEERRRHREVEEKKKKEGEERLRRLKEAEKRREALTPKDRHLKDSSGAGVTRARTKSEVPLVFVTVSKIQRTFRIGMNFKWNSYL